MVLQASSIREGLFYKKSYLRVMVTKQKKALAKRNKSRNPKAAKIKQFVKSFYSEHGKMMTKLAHE
jgi:hypothetical protein